MRSRRHRWLSFPARTALATILVLTVAGLRLPVSGAQDQPIAFPPCGEVFGIGDVTQSCLRVVNAGTSEIGPIDVYIGDTAVVEGLEYGQATEFASIPGESQQFRVVQAGTAVEEAVVDFTEELQPGAAYQMTVSGGLTPEELSSWLSGVDVSLLPRGQARVRVVHASPDLGPIDVPLATGEVPFAEIAYGSQSGDVPLEASAYIFQLRQTGEDTLLIETPAEVQLEEGSNYDLYVIGQSEAGTLELVVFATEIGVAALATPAAVATPEVAVGVTPVEVTPGAETPAPTPES